MKNERYCKFSDGTVKSFEEIKKGDEFCIHEHSGERLSCLDTNKALFLAHSDYDKENLGFKGEWIEGSES